MLMHKSVVDKLIYICRNYGGHSFENKLKEQIEAMTLSIHLDQNTNMSLVETAILIRERQARRIDISDVIPMKFHPTLTRELLRLYEMFSGHSNERKLAQAFASLDLTAYERIVNGNDVVLVPTKEYIRLLEETGRKGG